MADNITSLEQLQILVERDDVTRIEKIDAMEIAGALILGHDDFQEGFPLAFRCWRRALTLRLMDTEDCRPIYKTPLKSKSGQLYEWSTLADLERIEQQPAQRKIQSFLVRLRIFSSQSWDAVHRHFILPFYQFLWLEPSHGSSMSEALDLTWSTLDTMLRSERPHEKSLQDSVYTIIALIASTFYGLPKDDPNITSENLTKFVELVLMMDDKSEIPVAEAHHMKLMCGMLIILSRHPQLITEEMQLSLLQLVHRDGRDPSGFNLLHAACRIPDLEVLSAIRILVKLGADVNARNNVGDGVLHILAMQPGSETRDASAQLLVDFGAHLDMVNKEGMTAADLWFQKNTPEKKDVADLPDWLQEGVPKLMCLSSRVIRRHKLPYDDGAIVPAVLIPFVSLH